MKISTYMPAEPLRPFIKAYTVIESEDAITNRVLPDTSFALAFRLGGQISYINGAGKIELPRTVFSGLKKSFRLINYAAHSAAIVVLFKETGVSSFCRHPLQALFEQSLPLDSFFAASEISFVEERLDERIGVAAKIEVIEAFLLSKCVHFQPDPLVEQAVAQIHRVRGNIKIRELAGTLYISQDAFEKRFRKITGVSPKQFAQIVRMNRIIRENNTINSTVGSTVDLAFENGFYDQPHFIKDFKRYTGQTPTDFFRSSRFW